MFQHLAMLDFWDSRLHSHAFKRACSQWRHRRQTNVSSRRRSSAVSGVRRRLNKCENQTHSKYLQHSHYIGWRLKNVALLDFETDDGISEKVPLTVGVATVQQLVAFGGTLLIWCVIKKTETAVLFSKSDRQRKFLNVTKLNFIVLVKCDMHWIYQGNCC